MLRFLGPSGIDWRLEDGEYVIGRNPASDLVINDEAVSRSHARIAVSDGKVVLLDLGSRNGTLVNGVSVTGPTEIHAGDGLSLGGVEMKVVEGSADFDIDSSGESDSAMSGVAYFPMSEALKGPVSDKTSTAGAIGAISELGKMLVGHNDRDVMFRRALSLIGGIIPYDRVGLFLPGKEGGELSLAASQANSLRQAAPFRISRKIASALLEGKNAVFIRDVEKDSVFSGRESIIREGIKSAIAVPLLADDRVLGALYVDISRRYHYEENHLPLVAIFANILAAKLINQELLIEARDKELMESELAAASQIQASLLPRDIPSAPGYAIGIYQLQSRLVGGDLYDVYRLSDNRILILLADVSGKGMGAALLASNILGSFRTFYDRPGFDLYEAVCVVSNQLLRYHRPGDYATLFAGILETGNNTFEFINAGHNPPIVARAGGGLESLAASGIPVGLMEYSAWKKERLELAEGDLFFAYTDGITEAADSSGEFWGTERLEKLVGEHRASGPARLIESAVLELGRFVGDVPLGDDVTIVSFRREGRDVNRESLMGQTESFTGS